MHALVLHAPNPSSKEEAPQLQALTMAQALNAAMQQAMADDDRIVMLGEDIGISGGVFRITEGLQERFGKERVMDTPLSESAIIGAAYGMAVGGLSPLVEIQFADYMFPAMDQIVSEVAKLRYRSGGDCACPMVIRSPYGGGIRGGHYHSQSPEAYYCHTPGLKVVIPSTPAQAAGLLLGALADPDPVIFLEPKRLYRSEKETLELPIRPIPLGKARKVRNGSDISLFCYGSMVPICEAAALKLEAEDGATVDVIDLCTLNPIDEASILNSVRKTGRAVLVYEAPKTCGYGSEISALIAEKALDSLKAPIARVAGLDTPYPYTLEALYLPHPARVLRVLRDTLAYR